MNRPDACLREHELLASLDEEQGSQLLRAHLNGCPRCRSRASELRAELSALRATRQDSCPAHRCAPGPDPEAACCDHSPALSIRGPASSGGPPVDSASTQGSLSGKPDSPCPGGEQATDETPTPAAIGKYRVIGRFARSGQAEVYRVVHPQFHRELILKLARRRIREEGRSAIVAEGRHLAELEHPNIVRVHDLDFHEGRPFLIMEHIRGRTLAQFAREQRITPRRAAELVPELSGAVAFAHGRGIVHQDIKPGNVLIDESGRPRLIDFGLAWQEDAWSGRSTPGEGGTYAYIAPEQARLDPDRVRSLSDVFALGAVLYFLLTHKAPFAAESSAASRDRALRCDFDCSALKGGGVPHRLARICLEAMAAEPHERHATAEELASDLNRWLRQPGRSIGAALSAAILLAGTLFWRSSPMVRSDRHPDPSLPSLSSAPQVTAQAAASSAVEVPGAVLGPQYLVQVHRDSRILELKDAVPLQTGDRLVIRCDLPRGFHASIFWFDTEGRLAELTPALRSSGEPSDQLLYPPEGVVPLTGPPGTELVLVCGSRSKPVGRSEVEGLLTGGRPLPPLPGGHTLSLLRRG